jgi:type II secretory pathway component GspD/PulD (secretin)
MNVVTILALAVMGSGVHQQSGAKPAKAAAAPPTQVQQTAPVNPETVLCSIDAFQFNVATILQKLSESTKTNLIVLSPPETKLTLRLDNVTLMEMIRHVCAMSGLSFMKVGGTYVLASEDQLMKAYPDEWARQFPEAWAKLHPKVEPTPPVPAVLTQTYKLSHVNSTQIANALKTVFGEGKGAVVVAGPTPMTPTITDQNTSASTGQVANVIKTDGSSDPAGKTLIIRGTREQIDDTLEIIRQLDVPRPQVSIAVAIYDISNDAVKELGLSWTFGDLTITEKNSTSPNFGTFTRAPLTFNAKIQALETQERAKILAAPNVSVLDGEHAFILIGDRINFPVLVGYTQNNAPIFDKQQERVGIYLQVAANVSADNSITLSLYPQVSTVTGFLNINGASYPQISTREAQTTLRLKSGETFVMGGLFKDEEIKLVERVPILSSIPLLGELFKHRKSTKNSSQVIISITPIVLKPTDEPR